MNYLFVRQKTHGEHRLQRYCERPCVNIINGSFNNISPSNSSSYLQGWIEHVAAYRTKIQAPDSSSETTVIPSPRTEPTG